MSDDQAAFTIDLSGGPEETPAGKVGRIIGGVLLIIVGGVVGLASLVGYLIGGFIPAIADWYDLIGDGILFIGAIGLGIAIVGFELVRRSRKARRAADAAEAEAVMTKLKAAGVYDGTSTPQSIAEAMGETSDQLNDLTGGTTGIKPVTPPISGPTIT
jgi:MFS family permease